MKRLIVAVLALAAFMSGGVAYADPGKLPAPQRPLGPPASVTEYREAPRIPITRHSVLAKKKSVAITAGEGSCPPAGYRGAKDVKNWSDPSTGLAFGVVHQLDCAPYRLGNYDYALGVSRSTYYNLGMPHVGRVWVGRGYIHYVYGPSGPNGGDLRASWTSGWHTFNNPYETYYTVQVKCTC